MEKIKISSIILKPKKQVWDYYTLPQHITQWNFADPSWHCPHAENDVQVGGKYLARMEAKDGSFGFDFMGVYTHLNFGNSYTLVLEDEREVIVQFNSKTADSTDITILFDPETENPLEMQQAGWQAILNNFKNYCEQV